MKISYDSDNKLWKIEYANKEIASDGQTIVIRFATPVRINSCWECGGYTYDETSYTVTITNAKQWFGIQIYDTEGFKIIGRNVFEP